MLHRLRSYGFTDSTARLIGDAVLYALSKAVPGLVGLFTIVIFVRLLGASEFGRYSILSSTVLMWSAFASGWLNQGILRFNTGRVTTSRHDRGELTKGLVLSSLGCSAVVAINLQFWGSHPPWREAALCSLLALLTVGQSVALAFWQSNLKPHLVLWLELLRTLGGFVLALAFVWFAGATPGAVLAGTAAGYALSMAASYRPGSKSTASPGAKDDNIHLRRLWSYGWPLSFWLGIQTAFPWFDRWIIERSLGLAATGIFAGVSDVVTRSFTLLVFPLTLAVHPRITGLWNQNDREGAFRLLGRALTIAALASIPIVAAFYEGRFMLIKWLISSDHATPEATAVTDSVGLLALGGVVWQLSLLAHKPLELRNQTRQMLLWMVVALVIKVAFTVALLPYWGVKGVALGTLFSALVYCLGCFASSRSAASREARPDGIRHG